jgi:hypothetical protein
LYLEIIGKLIEGKNVEVANKNTNPVIPHANHWDLLYLNILKNENKGIPFLVYKYLVARAKESINDLKKMAKKTTFQVQDLVPIVIIYY